MSAFSHISKENLPNSLHEKHETGFPRLLTRLQPGHCFSIVGTRTWQKFSGLDTSVPWMFFSDAPFYHDKFNMENATKI